MRGIIFAACVLTCSAFGAPAAAEEVEPNRDWYVSGFAAVLIADENNILFDQFGWQGSLAVGRRVLDDRVSIELEATARRIGLVGLNGVADAPGRFKARSGFINAYYHPRPEAEWEPYVGAGFGRGRQNYQLRGLADETGFDVVMDDYSESFVYHFMGGVEVDLNPRFSARVEARYFTLEDKTIGANFGRWNGIERSYQLGAGLSYSFGK